MSGNYNQVPSREQVKIGSSVKVIEKVNYESGEVTEGFVAQILTSKPNHPRGIKVRLTSGIVGRVQALGGQPIIPVKTEEPEVTTGPRVDYAPSEDELL